jgi:hypothetical protein
MRGVDSQSLASDILDALNTSKEAAVELNNALLSENSAISGAISSDLRTLLQMLQNIGYEQCRVNQKIRLGQQAECALDSLDRVAILANTSFKCAQHKLEFELFPMLQEIYAQFYFWGYVYPDRKKLNNYYENELNELFNWGYLEDAEAVGKYKYELTITVLAFNKLDYTKKCCKNLLANIPRGLSYELILINHGSSDGTKEYFESLKPHKQFDIKINSCGLLSSTNRVIEGRFALGVSNDVLITSNAITNMLKTLRDDPSIAMVVPTMPNISNLQPIPADYKDLSGLSAFVKKNNAYDPYRHEQRTRLVNPVTMLNSGIFVREHLSQWGDELFSQQEQMFPDDQMAKIYRRAGYKLILAKDAYCHHFGSVTINSEAKEKKIDMNEVYRKGRIEFEKIYGIDPWGIGFCYDLALVSAVKCEFEGHIEVLGVNCGHGSNSLKIKELYKERNHNLDVTLTNVTSDTRYIEDLRGVSDSARAVRTIDEIFEDDTQYHHIVADDSFYGSVHNLDDLERMYKHLVPGGTLYVKYGTEREPIFKYRFPNAEFSDNWAVLRAGNAVEQ